MGINMSKYDQLLAVINSDNPSPIPFDLTNITFSDPVPDTGANWNTKITVNAIPNAGFRGAIDLFYNRIDLAAIGVDNWLFADVQFTEDIVLSLINTTRNAFMVPEDIAPLQIPGMRYGDIINVPLISDPISVNWIGQNNLNLFIGLTQIASSLQVAAALFDSLMNTDLATLGYLS